MKFKKMVDKTKIHYSSDEIKLISATQLHPLADLSAGVVDTKTLATRGEYFTNLTEVTILQR